jgi:hypothetical protein
MESKKNKVTDIRCLACEKKIALIREYRHVYLKGWDCRAVIDLEKGTVTVKCECGVGRVIRSRGNDFRCDKEMLSVWLEEINEANSGTHEDSDERASATD